MEWVELRYHWIIESITIKPQILKFSSASVAGINYDMPLTSHVSHCWNDYWRRRMKSLLLVTNILLTHLNRKRLLIHIWTIKTQWWLLVPDLMSLIYQIAPLLFNEEKVYSQHSSHKSSRTSSDRQDETTHGGHITTEFTDTSTKTRQGASASSAISFVWACVCHGWQCLASSDWSSVAPKALLVKFLEVCCGVNTTTTMQSQGTKVMSTMMEGMFLLFSQSHKSCIIVQASI